MDSPETPDEVHRVDPDDGAIGKQLGEDAQRPADIGYDAKRNRVLVPILTGNRIEIWQLK